MYGHERYFSKEINKDCLQYQYVTKGYKQRKLRDLPIEEKLELVEDIYIKKDYHENISARYKINRETIKSLMRNLKKDPSYLRKTYTKDKARR